jgi:transposase-like protein
MKKYHQMVEEIYHKLGENISQTAKEIGVSATCVSHWLGRLKKTNPNEDSRKRIETTYERMKKC